MKTPNPAKLTPKQLKSLLTSVSGDQASRVIKGIYNNPGILTHEVSGNFYCNNVPDIRQKTAPILMCHNLKLACYPQNKPNALTRSFHWYLCNLHELEYFDTTVNSANDEAL